jgi:DNA-binding MarR family transcriptional regulator
VQIKESKYSQCLYFTSAALARKVEKIAIDVWKEIDLPPSHAYLLMVVLEQPGIQPSGLVSELHLQPSTITRLVEKLELKKLLVRTTEGKITNIYPTPKAKELLPRMKQCVQKFYKIYSSLLGKEESCKLVNDIAIFADKIDT